MPMYMDIHEAPGVTADAVAEAHLADLNTQAKYGVEYHKYWLNEAKGKIFCLSERAQRGGRERRTAKRTDWLRRRSSKSLPRWPKAF